MILFDKLTGTKYPDSHVAPRSAEEVRAALLALNGPDVPYRVRNALPAEKADLVAECGIRRVGVTLKTWMRLIPEKHEVRFLDERWENRSGPANAQYGRGTRPRCTGSGRPGRFPTAVGARSRRFASTRGR
ncbi:hypothetical protein ACFRFU_24625 [Streptomyces sp. NPDC056704]|uniref:hypothetical protein n=1 Tax=Streptomyces sp. NPDC056704 TaxID=3345917 RepID=UPI0036761BD7